MTTTLTIMQVYARDVRERFAGKTVEELRKLIKCARREIIQIREKPWYHPSDLDYPRVDIQVFYQLIKEKGGSNESR